MNKKILLIFGILGLSLFILSGCTEKQIEDITNLDIEVDPITGDCLVVCPDGTEVKCGEECENICCKTTMIVAPEYRDSATHYKWTTKEYCSNTINGEPIVGGSRVIVKNNFCYEMSIFTEEERKLCEDTGGEIIQAPEGEECKCPDTGIDYAIMKFKKDNGCSYDNIICRNKDGIRQIFEYGMCRLMTDKELCEDTGGLYYRTGFCECPKFSEYAEGFGCEKIAIPLKSIFAIFQTKQSIM